MARTPKTPTDKPAETPAEKRREREAAEADVLKREVDEAVRQDELSGFVENYGKPLIGAIVLGLTVFAGYLYWDGVQEDAMEKESETLVKALDNAGVGNLDNANATASTLTIEGNGGAKAAAAMLQGGIAQQQLKPDEAAKVFAGVAADTDAPQALRDLAVVREVAATFDTSKPEDVIAKLKPLAVPGNAFFASAGEMVALSYLEQGKRDEAGALFAEIAKAEDTPESLRERARQMAGILGMDTIADVDEVLEGMGATQPAAAPAGQ